MGLCSGEGPAVVKVHVLSEANALPATSFTPPAPPLIVAVYVVPAARSAVGFNVATLFVLLYDTAAGTVVDPAVNVNVADVTVDGFIASEKVPVTFADNRHTGGTDRRRRSRHGRGRRIPAPTTGARLVVAPVPACGVHVGEHQQTAVGRAPRRLLRFCFVDVTLWTYWSASTIRAVFVVVKLMLSSGVDFS